MLLLASLSLLLLSSVARADVPAAATESPIAVQLVQLRRQEIAGQPATYVEAGEVRPGDIVEYRVRYTNAGTQPLAVTATLPIPPDMVYQADSASAPSGLAHTVALDDARFSAEPLKKTVLDSHGVPALALVPYALYRMVRWDLGSMPPGSSTEVSVRVKVATLSPEPDAASALPASE